MTHGGYNPPPGQPFGLPWLEHSTRSDCVLFAAAAAHEGQLGRAMWASLAASRTALSSAPVEATPLPTMSKAVPCAGVVKIVSSPAVTVTPRLKPRSFVAIW